MAAEHVRGGIAVAPHAAAAESAAAILREGGNAIEAMVAAAATIAVVYPHMNGLGGDAFWLVHEPGREPRSIDASGPAAGSLDVEFYRRRGLQAIPMRGPLAANTVAGTVAGWDLALQLSRTEWEGCIPLSRLLSDAMGYARDGIRVTRSQAAATHAKLPELRDQPGFVSRFAPDGTAPREGDRFVQATMAATLERLARAGLDDFYRGELAAAIADGLAAIGSAVRREDLAQYRAQWREPLRLATRHGQLYNMGPPTQGVVSLLILAIAECLGVDEMQPGSADHVHVLVEATKAAFGLRDRYVTDPRFMSIEASSLLDAPAVASLARSIDMAQAKPWGRRTLAADTVWMGVIDGQGRAVSFIQSIYHEFGSGIVLPETGINWQNRGCSFSLDERALNVLRPGRKPFHTLNPALARLADGRVMVYGTMGGDGQPQTQAAVFTRHVGMGMPLREAIEAPRWLLGRTWGNPSETLKLESRFDSGVIEELRRRGHDLEVVGAFDEIVGHAGALVRDASGALQGASDPRSDGGVAGI